jgi:DNA-binding transcriptional MerR regulator
MANYTIKDLENFTGVKAHTIRIWEKRYNVVTPKRTPTNIRFYDDDDLKKLLNVSILNRHGVKISHIINLEDEALNEKILNLTQTNSDLQNHIESLVVAMIDLDESKFEKIFTTAVINLGFEEAVLHVLYPFFEKVGILWQIGTVNPSQEHFISNLIRQKLIVAIDGLIQQMNEKTKTFLLFLPEGEYHELGLLFSYYIIKKNGHKVVYLGNSVPYDGIIETWNVKKIDYILSSFVTSSPEEKLQEYIDRFAADFPETNILISGLQTQINSLSLPQNVTRLNSAHELKALVS